MRTVSESLALPDFTPFLRRQLPYNAMEVCATRAWTLLLATPATACSVQVRRDATELAG